MRENKRSCSEAFSEAAIVGKTLAYSWFDGLGYLEQTRKSDVTFFAVTNQSLVRGFVVRQEISSHVRLSQVRTNIKVMHVSALRVQRWYRSSKNRRWQCLGLSATVQRRSTFLKSTLYSLSLNFLRNGYELFGKEARLRRMTSSVHGVEWPSLALVYFLILKAKISW